MQRIPHANGVITYTFESLAGLPVQAHISTRHGGVSPAPWSSLNFGISRGDTRENVLANRQRLADALGLDAASLVICQQVHGTGIAKVDRQDAGGRMEGCDGMVTDAAALPLLLVFADCVPVLLYDPARRVLGAVHAGWRGTVNGAAAALLWAMQAGYGTQPADVRACIGPSIGPASYEVGDEVLEMARAKLPAADRFFAWPNGAQSRPYLDLWAANRVQLTEAGVPEAQVEVAAIDTAHSTADFFSHRAEQGRCGLFAMTAWLVNG